MVGVGTSVFLVEAAFFPGDREGMIIPGDGIAITGEAKVVE